MTMIIVKREFFIVDRKDKGNDELQIPNRKREKEKWPGDCDTNDSIRLRTPKMKK